MKTSDLNNFTFYVNKDGSHDTMAIASNCMNASIYNIIKNSKLLENDIVLPLFVRDINPALWYDNNTGTFRIYDRSRNIISLSQKYIKLIENVRRHDDNSIQFLESILETGEMVVIQTVTYKLKIMNWFNPNYDIDTFSEDVDNHAFIILHHDEDNFYYSDKVSANIKREEYIPYEFNNQIGIIQKSDMVEACNYYLKCITINIDYDGISNPQMLDSEVICLIHSIADNFAGHIEKDRNYTRYYGLSALEKFIELCEQGVDLTSYYETPGWSLIGRISFDIRMIIGSRLILIEYFKSRIECSEEPEKLNTIIEKLEESNKQWELLENLMIRLIRTNKTKLDQRTSTRISKIIEVEKELSQILKSIQKI